jgi:ABC-type transport system involved in multi-copper enzyme maturation permease subunit
MMLALIRKEWRLSRAILIGCLVTMVMPYVLNVANTWINPSRGANLEPRDYVDAVKFAAFASLAITVVLAAAFGGQTFAGERRERTAEFLAMLPVSREAIIASKLVVPAACLAALIGVHVLVLVACGKWAEHIGLRRQDAQDAVYAAIFGVSYAVAVFGIAWALSVFLRSAAIAATVTIGIGVGMFFGMMAWGERVHHFLIKREYVQSYNEAITIAVICATVALIGIVAIVGSSLHYRRRVEP